MYTQISQYTLAGVILAAVVLAVSSYWIEQPQAKQQAAAYPMSDDLQLAEGPEALSVIQAASAMHNSSSGQSKDSQALQVEPHILKHYAGRYDKDN